MRADSRFQCWLLASQDLGLWDGRRSLIPAGRARGEVEAIECWARLAGAARASAPIVASHDCSQRIRAALDDICVRIVQGGRTRLFIVSTANARRVARCGRVRRAGVDRRHQRESARGSAVSMITRRERRQSARQAKPLPGRSPLLFGAKQHHRRADVSTAPALHLSVPDCGWIRIGATKRGNCDLIAVAAAGAPARPTIEAPDSEVTGRSRGACRPGVAGFTLVAFVALRTEGTRSAGGACRPGLAGFALVTFRTLRARRTCRSRRTRRPGVAGLALVTVRALRSRRPYRSWGACRPGVAGLALVTVRALRARRTCRSWGTRRPGVAGLALVTFRALGTGRSRGACRPGLAVVTFGTCRTLRTRRPHIALRSGRPCGARRPCKSLRALRARNTLRTLTSLRPLRTFRPFAAARQHDRGRKGRNDEN
jgi:hypothetical protein